MDHSHQGGGGGMEMGGSCSMNMIWNSDIEGVCEIVHQQWRVALILSLQGIVHPLLRVNGIPSLLFYMILLFLLSIAFEQLRVTIADNEDRLRSAYAADWDPQTGKRRSSTGKATGMTGESSSCECEARPLLSLAAVYQRKGRQRLRLPRNEQLQRSALYVLNITISFFLMLVIMTYNTYLIGAVLTGAAFGHFFLHDSLPLAADQEPDRGMACH